MLKTESDGALCILALCLLLLLWLLLLFLLLLEVVLCTFLSLCFNLCPELGNEILESIWKLFEGWFKDTGHVHLSVKAEAVLD